MQKGHACRQARHGGQAGFSTILAIVGILVITVIAGGAFYLGQTSSKPPSPNPVISSEFPKSSDFQSVQPSNSYQTPFPTATFYPLEQKDSVNLDKVYTNPLGGYTLAVPTGFKVFERGANVGLLSQSNNDNIDVSVVIPRGVDSLETWFTHVDRALVISVYYTKETTLDGVRAIQRLERRGGIEGEFDSLTLYAFPDSRLFTLLAYNPSDGLSEAFEAVRKSFKINKAI